MPTPAAPAAEDRPTFEGRVRAWFEANAPRKGGPGDFSAAHLVSAASLEEYHRREREALDLATGWQRRLHDAGLAGCSWPVAYGGRGGPSWQDEVVVAEQARWGVSTKVLAIGLEMVAAVLFAHGTHEQRLAHLPRVVRGDEVWCQLLSEPDAGSDLGGVRTSATAVDGGWELQGQKVWTSGAGVADVALCIARSDPASTRHSGLTWFAVDMADPAVTVRPLRQMSGAYHFNEVFLDGVVVPPSGVIGGLGEGWSVLRTMLTSERAAIGGGTSGRSARQMVALVRRSDRVHEGPLRQEVVTAVTRERLLDLLAARLGDVPAGGSVAKLAYSEHARLSADTATRLLGPPASLLDDEVAEPWVERLLFAPGLRLGGGTDEIQRTTIAEQGLGLPREPRPRSSGA
jgi:alkylation response protein AidB-like acyl-CoA dehydrogenase